MNSADITAIAERIRVATDAARVVIRIELGDGTSFNIPSESVADNPKEGKACELN